MKCLLCFETITDSTAQYTTSCRHVFCNACWNEKVVDQLVCPLCDTVLPKDGTQTINLKPDEDAIMKASQPSFGLEPKQLCSILQNGLEFWEQQRNNESAIHLQKLNSTSQALEEEKALNRKLSLSLENEKRKVSTITEEKQHLMARYEKLEHRYEEKCRSLRTLNESYKQLRMIHKRLERDIRQTKPLDEKPYDDENEHTHAQEVSVAHRSGSGTGAWKTRSRTRSLNMSFRNSARNVDEQHHEDADIRVEDGQRDGEREMLSSGKRRVERSSEGDRRGRYD